MTEIQMIRAERRERMEMRRRERRADAIKAAVILGLILLGYALAGTLDYADRTEGLGASMTPSPTWWEVG